MKAVDSILSKIQHDKSPDFSRIYDQYIDKIYRFIFFKVQSRDIAEDLTSDVFFKVMTKWGQFNSEKGNFNSWIYQIARNRVIDFYRQNRKHENIEEIWDLDSGEDLLSKVDDCYRLDKLHGYLKGMKKETREIVMLKVWEGLSYQEISSIVGKSEGSCKMTVSRTMKKIRQQSFIFYLILLLGNIWK